MIHCPVCSCQYKYIIIRNFFLLVCQFQEILIDLIQLFLISLYTQHMQTMLQSGTSTTSRQDNSIIINTNIFRINDLVSLYILQNSILMNSRRMRKSISSHNRLIRLNRHIHQARHRPADTIYFGSIDISRNSTFFMALENHGYFFQRSISGTLSNTINRYFYLTSAIQYPLNGIGSSHSQIIMAVS